MWPLGSRIVIVYDFSFLIVNLLAFFVTHEKNNAAKQENGGTPTHSIRPTELPYRSVTPVQLSGEEHRVYYQGYEDWNHWKSSVSKRDQIWESLTGNSHDYHSETVVFVFGVVVFCFKTHAGKEGRHGVRYQGDDA